MKMKRCFVVFFSWWIINTLNQAVAVRDDEVFAQVDLQSDKQNIICAREKKPLDCTAGSTIAINSAFWGRLSSTICPSEDGDLNTHCQGANETLQIVRSICDGIESCELEARHELLQAKGVKHCPGVNKYLIVSYTCEPKAKEVVLCDSENSTISCPDSYKLFVNSVFWGRQSTRVCPSEHGQTMCMGTTDSLGVVRTMCQGQKECPLSASYGQVQKEGESCPGVLKYLIVNYSCKNPESESFEVNKQTDVNHLPLDLIRKILARNKEETKSNVMKADFKHKLRLDAVKPHVSPNKVHHNLKPKPKEGDRIVSIEITSPLKSAFIKQNEETPFSQTEPEAGDKKKEINPMISDGTQDGNNEGGLHLADTDKDTKTDSIKMGDDNVIQSDETKSHGAKDVLGVDPVSKEDNDGEIKSDDDLGGVSDSKKPDENIKQKTEDRQSMEMQTKDYNIDLQDLPTSIVKKIIKLLILQRKKMNGVTDVDSGEIIKDPDTVIDRQDIEISDRKDTVATPLANIVENKDPEKMNLEELRATTLNELKKSLLPRPLVKMLKSHGVLKRKSKIEHPKKYKYYGHGFAGHGNMP